MRDSTLRLLSNPQSSSLFALIAMLVTPFFAQCP
ncbi:unnamed protein product [Brassica oleracea var. botrytis]